MRQEEEYRATFWTEYKINFIKVNRLLGLAFTVFVIVVILITYNGFEDIQLWLAEARKDLFTVIAGLSATLFGFILTNISILLVLPGSGLKKRLQYNQKLGKQIYDVNFSALFWLGFITAISVVGLIIKQCALVCMLLIFYSLIVSVLQMGWCLYILRKIILLSLRDIESSD